MSKRKDWITFEGFHATKRGVAMLLEARRLYTKKTGKAPPAMSQGGKSFATASGNTHGREAFDFRTRNMSDEENRIWQWCLRVVGFKSWWRRKLTLPSGKLVWPEHNHAVPEGGDLSDAAAVQVKAAHNGRNGLKSNLHDPTWDGLERRTWEEYRRLHPKPKPAPVKPKPLRNFKLSSFKGAVKAGAYNRNYPSHVAVCQVALQALGYEPGPVDGIKGKQTISAMNRFLAKWGWPKASGRILTFQMLDRLILEAEKLHPGTGYPPRGN